MKVDALPLEILVYILNFLQVEDLHSLKRSSKFFKDVVQNSFFIYDLPVDVEFDIVIKAIIDRIVDSLKLSTTLDKLKVKTFVARLGANLKTQITKSNIGAHLVLCNREISDTGANKCKLCTLYHIESYFLYKIAKDVGSSIPYPYLNRRFDSFNECVVIYNMWYGTDPSESWVGEARERINNDRNLHDVIIKIIFRILVRTFYLPLYQKAETQINRKLNSSIANCYRNNLRTICKASMKDMIESICRIYKHSNNPETFEEYYKRLAKLNNPRNSMWVVDWDVIRARIRLAVRRLIFRT